MLLSPGCGEDSPSRSDTPRPGVKGTELVAFQLDEEGKVFLLPSAWELRDGTLEAQAKPLPPGAKALALVEMVEALDKACKIAPQRVLRPTRKKGTVESKGGLPIRFRLSWNPSRNQCGVHIGTFLTGYGTEGFKNAAKKGRMIRETGAHTVEIDADSGVPGSELLEAIRVARDLDRARIQYPAPGSPPPADVNDRPLPLHLRKEGEDWTAPDVRVRFLVHSKTPAQTILRVLWICTGMGIYRITVNVPGGKCVEMCRPSDFQPVFVEEETLPRDIFQNEKEIDPRNPPIEDPVLKEQERLEEEKRKKEKSSDR
jgi:hypothetical protein